MGDKSPKSTRKKAGQKQDKSNKARQIKKAAADQASGLFAAKPNRN
jgi:hypothetical protein